MEKQVVTKQRVTDHGEVYTNKREVNAMLDLVVQETERIDSRFLEPACGTGNFLTEILERKLKVVKSRYAKNQLDYERYAVIAISSIYGIDILEDNIVECCQRLFAIFDREYSGLFKKKAKDECKETVRYLLAKNILWGDALTLKTVGGDPKSIVFSEWSPVNGSQIKRRDFAFNDLVVYASGRELPLLAYSDEGEEAYIPEPVKEFPLIHFLKVAELG